MNPTPWFKCSRSANSLLGVSTINFLNFLTQVFWDFSSYLFYPFLVKLHCGPNGFYSVKFVEGVLGTTMWPALPNAYVNLTRLRVLWF